MIVNKEREIGFRSTKMRILRRVAHQTIQRPSSGLTGAVMRQVSGILFFFFFAAIASAQESDLNSSGVSLGAVQYYDR